MKNNDANRGTETMKSERFQVIAMTLDSAYPTFCWAVVDSMGKCSSIPFETKEGAAYEAEWLNQDWAAELECQTR